MPALQLIALETTTPQLRAPASGDTYSAPRAVDITPETLTGSSATSSLSITQTWNTSGTPTALSLNVTDTASNAASLLMDLRVGGSSLFAVSKTFGGISFTQASTTARTKINLPAFSEISTTDGRLAFSAGSNIRLYIEDGVTVFGNGTIGFSSGALTTGLSAATDVSLRRDAANTLAQRNGVNAQAFNIYNTYTDASNYERGFVRWSSNRMYIGTEAAGTGSNRELQFLTAGLTRWKVLSTGDFCAGTDDTYSIGANASDRPRNINMTGYTQMQEDTAPAAPAASNVRIYAENNGSGKTRLMALFATGVAQQLAIEP